jgi:hypothetical protein
VFVQILSGMSELQTEGNTPGSIQQTLTPYAFNSLRIPDEYAFTAEMGLNEQHFQF